MNACLALANYKCVIGKKIIIKVFGWIEDNSKVWLPI